MAKKARVLSIDGGGIRGIVPAVILSELEKATGKPIAQMFDLIVGTSSGGVLALGLVIPGDDGKPKYTADDGVRLYMAQGHRIFTRSTFHKLRSVWSVEGEKYPSRGIETVFREYYGETRLKEAITPVVVTSYEIERRAPFFFKSELAKADEDEYDFLMWQVARATTAAPTFFEPARLVAASGSRTYSLVDAGIFVNDPAMSALAEARAMGLGDDVLIVSLGSGESTQPILYQRAVSWGLRQWAQPLFGISFDGTSSIVNYQLQQLLPENRYYRFQAKLNECNDAMDDTSPTNLRSLQLLGQNIVEASGDAFREMCEQLT
jgi:patatin-like phospholipase/acyl hydrolase